MLSILGTSSMTDVCARNNFYKIANERLFMSTNVFPFYFWNLDAVLLLLDAAKNCVKGLNVSTNLIYPF